MSNSAAASGSAAVGETRKLNDHSAPKTPGSSSASLGHSKVHAGKAEADESHHASTSEQPRAEDGGEGTGGGNGSVKVAGEGGPVPAETAQDPSQSQAEQEEKSRSSDSQSMTPSEDSDGDAKSGIHLPFFFISELQMRNAFTKKKKKSNKLLIKCYCHVIS